MPGSIRLVTVTHLQPPQVPGNPAFSAGVSVAGPARTIFVGGQNGIGSDGSIAGDDVASQMRQALRNVELVLAEADAELTDVVHWRVALVQGADLRSGFAAFQQVWGERGKPPAVSVDIVAGLASPAFLVEITAVAAVSA
jgi:enamine deaminase RidA (YjgF/YER057c/UK114 family)